MFLPYFSGNRNAPFDHDVKKKHMARRTIVFSFTQKIMLFFPAMMRCLLVRKFLVHGLMRSVHNYFLCVWCSFVYSPYLVNRAIEVRERRHEVLNFLGPFLTEQTKIKIKM